LIELLVILDALKRASGSFGNSFPACHSLSDHLLPLRCVDAVKRVTAVLPYYGYARQDRRMLSRQPISAKLVRTTVSSCLFRCLNVNLSLILWDLGC
jgi:phosphoribosylpyrophosphate synthetase